MKITDGVSCPTCHRPATRIQSAVLGLDAYEPSAMPEPTRRAVTRITMLIHDAWKRYEACIAAGTDGEGHYQFHEGLAQALAVITDEYDE